MVFFVKKNKNIKKKFTIYIVKYNFNKKIKIIRENYINAILFY